MFKGPQGLVHDQDGMMRIALDFYKELFAKENKGNLCLSESFWSESEKVTAEENNQISASFTETETRRSFLVAMLKGPWPRWPFLFFF